MKDAEIHKGESEKPEGGSNKPARHRSRRRKAAVWAMRGSFVLVVLAVISALMVVGQTMHAPQWLRDRVEQRLELFVFGDLLVAGLYERGSFGAADSRTVGWVLAMGRAAAPALAAGPAGTSTAHDPAA